MSQSNKNYEKVWGINMGSYKLTDKYIIKN